jgi:hypothetical protein
MYSEELFAIQQEWSERALFLLRELLPLMTPVARFPEWTEDERQTLGWLLSASARSSESAMLLCAYGQLWDAEVILRSVFEASLKFVYLLQNRQEFKQRHEEYANALFQIALLKDHQKAQDLLNVIPTSDAMKWKPIRDRLLSEDALKCIGQQYDKSTRRALDTKWGFTGIVGVLTKSGDALVDRVVGLAHGYSMASHILHADSVGVSIPMDRDRRSAERRDKIHLAHLTRLISDACSCLQMRLAAGYRYIDHDPSPVFEAAAKMNDLRQSFGDVYENWMDVEYGNSAEDPVSER